MRTLIPFVCAAALAVTAIPALARPAPEVTQVPKITQVIVHGRKLDWSDLAKLHAKVPGPAMWKLTRGAGTVWVIAVIEEAPNGLAWDDRFLKQTLDGARTLITPGSATFSADGQDRYKKRSVLPAGTSLQSLVSADTYRRLGDTVAREPHLTLDTYTGFVPARAGAELYDNVLAWHGIGSDIPQISEIVALARGTATEVKPALRFNGDQITDRLLALDAAGNETCLIDYLDGIDYDLDTLPRVAKAWADGDVTNAGLFYRDTPALSCDLLTPGWQASVEAGAIADMTGAIDDALRRPGKSVAVMRFGQLLRKGGILDQLHARGVEIAPAE